MSSFLRSCSIFLFSLIFLSAFCGAQSITLGLIQYYPFTNGPKDESNHSPDAKVYASNLARDMHGYIEGSPTLVGNTYYIEFPDSVNLGTPGWTYSVWFKLYSFPTEIEEADAFLLSYKTLVTGDDVHLFVDDEDNRLKVFFKSGALKVSTGITIQRGRWYHAAVRYGSTTDIFVDGVLAVSSSGRFTSPSTYTPLVISSIIPTFPSKGRVFGNIDDIRMYKRTLSNAEINLIYTTEKNMVAPPPPKDTIYIRDTIIIKDTITVRDTIIIRDTIYKLDTIILGGSCVVYPNPVSALDPLHIQTGERPATIFIYNAAGQFIRREVLTTQDYIRLTGLSSGIYFLKIVTATGQCGKKITLMN